MGAIVQAMPDAVKSLWNVSPREHRRYALTQPVGDDSPKILQAGEGGG
ncbi:MAG: hypothetical protein KKB66_05450 [Alphaproteobacteria bacterium]|nr:hypothetical protein [Alphaproteobacteria bacterium]MBU0803085.1 hypothetical protein [Alphaproteobacteria bacterium]MBU0873773.1 hypothetical protein [Alphaproteobacteria bacterium]MBU1400727.1 hypothetical protein [Alphaproteobacteria bacterium]MBU1590600.1 hypothetical protein [Alphaproteobacteria bacterium]